MSFLIAKLTAGIPGTIQINETEYTSYKVIKHNLLNSLHVEEKFDFVIGDYLEYEEELLKLGARHMVLPRETITKVHIERRLISRRIANLLSVCRLYICQSKHHMSNIFGLDSNEYKAVDDEQSTQYDSLLGYRILEAMRNHVQHRGYPIHSVKYSRDVIDDGVLHAFNPYIKIEFLEDDPKFKSATLDEMKNLGEEINIVPYIREYIEGLSVVQRRIRETLDPHTSSWDEKLYEIGNRYIDEYGAEISLAGLAIISVDENDNIIEKEYINTNIIDRRKALRKKNRDLSGMLNRYVSNEIKT